MECSIEYFIHNNILPYDTVNFASVRGNKCGNVSTGPGTG